MTIKNNEDLLNIVQYAPIGICIIDANTLVSEMVNNTFLEIAGKPYEAIYGKYYWDSFREAAPYYEAALASVVRDGTTYRADEMELMLIRNGQEEWVFVTFVYEPVKDKNGTVQKVAIWMLENTQQVKSRQIVQQLNEELTAANEELAASNEELAATIEKLLDSNEELLLAQNSSHISNQKLSESEDRFRAMAESTQVFIGVSDETGNAIYFNSIWSQMTGRSNEALLAFGWADLVHPDDKELALRNYKTAVEKKMPFTNEFRILTKEGNYIWLFVQGIPRLHADGSFAGHIGSAFDITQRKQDEQRKNDFIGMVSHELKTPLTSMYGYLQLLKMKPGNEDAFAASLLDRANKQVSKMTTLINGFLNVSRLESGKIYINKQHFDMAVLVREAEEEAITMYNTHRIVFAPVEETIVNADKDKIGQVISNLISNAVKYSPADTLITVICIIRNGVAVVSVKDEGIGIKDEDKDKLFDRYYRVNNDSVTSVADFGIGLYLCAEIIQRHDGKIWLESEVGKGSTFYCSLPLI